MYVDILIIIITFPYFACISSFFGSSIPTSLFILKMFSVYGRHSSRSVPQLSACSSCAAAGLGRLW